MIRPADASHDERATTPVPDVVEEKTSRPFEGVPLKDMTRDWFGRWRQYLAWGNTPWWGKVTAVYLLARVVSAFFFLLASRFQVETSWTEAQPGYFDYVGLMWDATWYKTIADEGYPTEIPRNSEGAALENQWAFYPLFPIMVKAITLVTGWGWAPVAAILATLLGLGAALMIYRLFCEVTSERTAFWGVVFVLVNPVAPILQTGYAESLQILLLSAALYLMLKRQYWLVIPVVLIMGFARPTGVPFAIFMLAHFCYRWFNRKNSPFPPVEIGKVIVLGLVSGFSAFLWLLTAWVVTGDMHAYTDTESAWRGGEGVVFFEPWVQVSQILFGPVGPFVLLLTVGLFAWAMFTKPMREIGVDLRLWVGAYVVYLLAVFYPWTSTWRLLLPIFPVLLGLAVLARPRWAKYTVIVVSLVLQALWVTWLWNFYPIQGSGDWAP